LVQKKIKASEHDEQCIFIKWCDLNKIPVYSNPNGIYMPVPKFLPANYQSILRSTVSKILSKMKKEGAFRKGLPDITIPVASNGYGALYIEMKIKGNYATKEQKQYMEMLEKNGNKCVVCYGSFEAIQVTKEYLQGK